MSKLGKLITDPRRFLMDSKVYRRLMLTAFAPSRAQVEDLGLGAPLGSIADREELERAFIDDLASQVPVMEVPADGRRTIAVLREDGPRLSKRLHDRALAGTRIRIEAVAPRAPSLPSPSPGDVKVLDIGTSTSVFDIDELIRPVSYFVATITGSGNARSSVLIEIWDRVGLEYVGPRRNPVAKRISIAMAAERGFFRAGTRSRLEDLLLHPLATHVGFPVDIVYTWVNHRDPGWRALWRDTVGSEPEQEQGDSRGLDRYQNRDELKYSLRSVAQFAPWVRRIHVVTNCAPPPWLDLAHSKIRWVAHEAILPSEALPVFNSHAIESRLQHVPELADHFLYFNDDFFLMRPTLASHFFEHSGLSKSFIEGHGSAIGDPNAENPDYLNAAINGRKLIEEAFSRSVPALHRHTPYALRREVLLEMEQRFAGPIGRTSSSRFRSIEDISTVSFLYHHFAYLTGKAIYTGTDARLIKPQTSNYPWALQQLVGGIRTPLTLCLNDGGGSDMAPNWGRDIVDFLEAYFPYPCEFERSA